MGKRSDKFEAKVGDSEDMFCSNCRKVRPHIWRVDKEQDSALWGPAGSSWYEYSLQCKFCPNKTTIYTTK